MLMLHKMMRTSLAASAIFAAVTLQASTTLAHPGHGGGGGDHGGFSDSDHGSSGEHFGDQHEDLEGRDRGFTGSELGFSGERPDDRDEVRYHREGARHYFHGRDFFTDNYDDDDCYPEWANDAPDPAYREAICPNW